MFLRFFSRLLDLAQPTDDLLEGDGVDVEERFDGDHNLRQVVGDDLRQLLHNLGIAHLVVEDAAPVGEADDALREVIDRFAVLEGDLGELLLELGGVDSRTR